MRDNSIRTDFLPLRSKKPIAPPNIPSKQIETNKMPFSDLSVNAPITHGGATTMARRAT
jgi:hypothetical protein